MSFKIEIPELKKLQNGLKSLPQKVAKRVLQKALKTAAEDMMVEAKSRTRDQTGNLDDSMRTRTKKISDVAAEAYLEAGAKGVFYARMVEYGSKWVLRRNGVTIAAGTIAPNPFFRGAFDARVEASAQLIASEVGEGVRKEFRKLAKKGGGG
jgi:HK97 gp10 family phage protein